MVTGKIMTMAQRLDAARAAANADIETLLTMAERIRGARVAAGLSQRALAKRLGVTHGIVARWEIASKKPGRDALFRLAEVTGTDPSDLLEQEQPVGNNIEMLRLFDAVSAQQKTSLLQLIDVVDDKNRVLRLLQWFSHLSPRQQKNFLEFLAVCVDVRRDLDQKRQPPELQEPVRRK